MQYNIGDKVKIKGESKVGTIQTRECFATNIYIYCIAYDDGTWTTESEDVVVPVVTADEVLANGEILVDKTFEEAFCHDEYLPNVRTLVIKYKDKMFYVCTVGGEIDWMKELD